MPVIRRAREAYVAHPVACLAAAAATAFAVRLAATPFGTPPVLDVYAYALKALEISRGFWTPVRSHAIGWSFLLAPFVGLMPPMPMLTVLDLTRVVASAVDALAVIPFAVLARETLDRRAQLVALALFPFVGSSVQVAVGGFAEPLLSVLFISAIGGVLVGRRSRAALVGGAVAAGLASVVHPTGIAIPIIAAGLAVATADRGRRLAAAGLVIVVALLVAAPAAAQRAHAFGNPMSYGFNNRFFVEQTADLASGRLAPPILSEFLAQHSIGGILVRLGRGASLELRDFIVHAVHVPAFPFVVYGSWLAVRSTRLRPVALALAAFLLSWVPVYEVFGLGRHLAPAVPLGMILTAAGIVELTRHRRHAGAWALALVVIFAAGESAAVGIQRYRAVRSEWNAGLEWGRWIASHVRGRLVLARGDQLVMMFLPDATVGGADIYTLFAPHTGLALLRSGDFPTIDEAFGWMQMQQVTHLLVDGRYHKGTCFEPLMSADIVPPFLTEVYATGSDSRWPVRLFEIRWERRDPRRS